MALNAGYRSTCTTQQVQCPMHPMHVSAGCVQDCHRQVLQPITILITGGSVLHQQGPWPMLAAAVD